jgi:hypothetical protein
MPSVACMVFAEAVNRDNDLSAGSPVIGAGDPNGPLDPDGTWADM